MAHLRLFFVFAAIAALGYVAYRKGWMPIPFNQAAPSAAPTLGFNIQESRHTRHRHPGNIGQELGSGWGKHGRRSHPSSLGPGAPVQELASIPKPGPNTLELPGAPATAPTAAPAGAQLPFPKSFEGCWTAYITEPETWVFGRGPVVKGISPANIVLCFHYSGTTPEVTFSTTAEYPVVSDWVVSHVGVENGHTEILFSGDNFVVLRNSSSTPLQMKILDVFPGPTGLITARTDFHCTHLPNDKLMVEASTIQRCNNAHSIDCDGDMWIKESWHTEFSRQ
jgi:hypothetical protein